MTELDPNAFQRHLNQTLARFVATSSPINEIRTPHLAHRLREKISQLTFVKGPYVETLPDFEKGRSLASLFQDGKLASEWQAFGQMAPHVWNRPLHAHQEEALLRGENYLVATGTGSGKTESFLYPLVNEIFAEGDLDTPGVRAILVYPLNALANDQWHRIARLLFRDLGDPGITLGRYTSQVKSGATRGQEETRLRQTPSFIEAFGEDADVSLNWRLSRQEMRDQPPHILITNYAMLEHILLLPTNRPLLQNARLKWIVLDEIHTYAGAQAIEVAFLLRRLKSHLALPDGVLRCVGTSASLDPGRKGELADFAGRLFGEAFGGAASVITSLKKRHPALAKTPRESGLSPEHWERAGELAGLAREAGRSGSPFDADTWNFEAELMQLDALKVSGDARSLGDGLIDLLSGFTEVAGIAHRLEGGATPIATLARDIFPNAGEAAIPALTGLVAVGVLAVSADASVFPLLPARYHLISRAPDRVGVSLAAGEPEQVSEIVVGPEYDADDRPAFELHVCRNCGEAYLEAWETPNGLSPVSDFGERRLLRLVSGGRAAEEDEDEDDAGDDDPPVLSFDPKTGFPLGSDDKTAVHFEDVALETDPDDGKRYLKRCVACRHMPARFAEPITTVRSGDEALSAVAAQSLLESLPRKDLGTTPPMGGRNLLVFSDNRQDAAFFAPFFERTSREQAIRAAILRAIEKSGAMDIENLVSAVERELRGDGLRLYRPGVRPLLEQGENQRLRLKALIAAELTVFGRGRLSLEGFGLVAIDHQGFERPVRAVEMNLPEALKPHADSYTRFLFKAIRAHRAISDKESGMIDLTDESIWSWMANQQTRCITRDRNARATTALALIPTAKRENRFTDLLKKMAGALGKTISDNECREVLVAFWKALESPRSMTAPHGVGRGLKLDATFIVRPGREVALYQCSTCGARTQFDTAGVCQSFGCEGHLQEIPAKYRERLAARNYYVSRYLEHPMLGIAREHTAAIAGEVRAEIEDEFKSGEINLLSCTTTMEMGVDLGDLEAVLCKNVPPSIANYQQRAGRAGRRAQVAPIVLTTSRSGRFDRAVFDAFEEYLAAKPIVPYLTLDNAGFFQRHQLAMVLARFLDLRLANYQRSGAPRLRDVFADVLSEAERTSFNASLEQWISLSGRAFQEAAGLGSRLPAANRGIALDAAALTTTFRDRMMRFADAIWGRWGLMQDSIDALEHERGLIAKNEAERITRIDRILGALRAQQKFYLDQFLVDQLSRRAIIPTYSFPVHSVSLEVLNSPGQSSDNALLELDRDGAIGITEYAPGSEVVAGGRVWVSDGISKRSKFTGDDRFIERARYRICDSCGSPQITVQGADPESNCAQCNTTFAASVLSRNFIRPHGFVTSVANGQGRDPGASRIRAPIADEARLLTEAPDNRYTPTDVAGIRTFHAPGSNKPDKDLGRIITVNRGKYRGGFAWCRKCEHAEPVEGQGPGLSWQNPRSRLAAHRNPRTGLDCDADPATDISPVDLAHVFETDVRAFLFTSVPRRPDAVALNQDPSLERTMQEALRLGAIDLLETDTRDIKALKQSLGGRLVVVLYDSVSGGAGYATRLTTETGYEVRDLLLKTRHLLLCPNPDCLTSCTRCLNDYSNQNFWPEFNRRPALAWIEAMLLDAGVKIDPQWDK
jgi:hypothetical protein